MIASLRKPGNPRLSAWRYGTSKGAWRSEWPVYIPALLALVFAVSFNLQLLFPVVFVLLMLVFGMLRIGENSLMGRLRWSGPPLLLLPIPILFLAHAFLPVAVLATLLVALLYKLSPPAPDVVESPKADTTGKADLGPSMIVSLIGWFYVLILSWVSGNMLSSYASIGPSEMSSTVAVTLMLLAVYFIGHIRFVSRPVFEGRGIPFLSHITWKHLRVLGLLLHATWIVASLFTSVVYVIALAW